MENLQSLEVPRMSLQLQISAQDGTVKHFYDDKLICRRLGLLVKGPLCTLGPLVMESTDGTSEGQGLSNCHWVARDMPGMT